MTIDREKGHVAKIRGRRWAEKLWAGVLEAVAEPGLTAYGESVSTTVACISTDPRPSPRR
jgi:hypothetical protein